MGRYSNSGVGKRSYKEEKHWKELDFTKVRIKKPTLLCLGGNGTIDDWQISDKKGYIISGSERANGVCAIAERLIGLRPEQQNVYSTYTNVDFYSFHYGKDSLRDRSGYFLEDDVKKIVRYILMPLCLDKDLKKLPVEAAAKNLSLITFFTHCHGAKEVANIMNQFSLYLYRIGYNIKEVDFLISCMTQITYSPLTDEFHMPTIKIDSFMDKFNIGMDECFKEAYKYNLNGIATFIDKKGSLWGKENPLVHHDVLSVYTSKLLNNSDMQKVVDEHSIENIDRNKEWLVKSGAKNADTISKIVGYSIARSIARSFEIYETKKLINPIDLHEMKEEVDSLTMVYNKSELEG